MNSIKLYKFYSYVDKFKRGVCYLRVVRVTIWVTLICFRVVLVCLGVKSYCHVDGVIQVIIVSYSIVEFLRHFLAVIPDFERFWLFRCFKHFPCFLSFRHFLELLSSWAFQGYFLASCDVRVLLVTLESLLSKLRKLSIIILVELSLVNFFKPFGGILRNYEFLRILRNYEFLDVLSLLSILISWNLGNNITLPFWREIIVLKTYFWA